MAKKHSPVLRTGMVSIERNGKVYTAGYEVLAGGKKSVLVRLQTGHVTHLVGSTEEGLAHQLLSEIISTGLADKEGLGRLKS